MYPQITKKSFYLLYNICMYVSAVCYTMDESSASILSITAFAGSNFLPPTCRGVSFGSMSFSGSENPTKQFWYLQWINVKSTAWQTSCFRFRFIHKILVCFFLGVHAFIHVNHQTVTCELRFVYMYLVSFIKLQKEYVIQILSCIPVPIILTNLILDCRLTLI